MDHRDHGQLSTQGDEVLAAQMPEVHGNQHDREGHDDHGGLNAHSSN
jgi:hypothetical protein